MEGVDVGVVGGHLRMPGILIDVVDLREIHYVVPGDGHVDLSVAVPGAPGVDISVWADRHVAPVRARRAPGAGVERLVPHNTPLRRACDRPVPVKDVAHPLSVPCNRMLIINKAEQKIRY